MISSSLIMSCLAGGMLVVALYITSRMRLGALVGTFRLLSVLLALLALAAAIKLSEFQLVVVAFLIFAIKGWLIPTFLVRAAKKSGASERLTAYARPTTLAFVGVCITVFAFAATARIAALGVDYIILSASFSVVLIGLLLLVSRKDMFGQGIGFFVMENGIFTFGLALTNGMPFLFEIGSLFDLLAFFILITVFTHRAQGEHASVETDHLRTLTD